MSRARERVKTRKFDAADYLDSSEVIITYLDDIFASEDAALIAHGLGVVARSRGMSKVAKKAGLTRENLYKALSAEGNPEFGTILKVMSALDLHLAVKPAA